MTTSTIDTTQTLAELVLDHSECAEVLTRHRLDFCCRGHLSLQDAARQRGLDLEALVADLVSSIARRDERRRGDVRDLATGELIDLIVSRHHDYLREALPFIGALAAKVSSVHGGNNPKLYELHEAVGELIEALDDHLAHEEQELFPALVAAAANGARVGGMLDAMADEHEQVAELLARVRAASDDFTLPAGACRSYTTLFAELADLEADVFAHVHLENHVLRPRFAATMEQANGSES